MPIASVAGFVEALRESHVLEPNQLEEVARQLQARFPDPRALARELVRRGWLTPHQVNQLFQGHGKDLVLGPYVLLERLGEGGMGQVFKARHGRLERIVAIKVIRKERLVRPDVIRRFRREIQAAAQLSHPNVVHAYDADQAGDRHFFVMEFVEGIDLAKLVKQRGPLSATEACDYIRQAALGLQHAHEHGLVHRDIKPANLLVTFKTSGCVVKVLDMGLARLHAPDDERESGSSLTQEGTLMGTPDYISPEQAMSSHTVDIRSDLYSLGCTFYFLLTGTTPFRGGSFMDKLLKHRLDEARPVEEARPDVPPEVGAVVRKLMAKRPEERYQTPGEVAAELDWICQSLRSQGDVPAAAEGSLPQAADGAAAGYETPASQETAVPSLLQKAAVQRRQREQEKQRLVKMALLGAGGVLALGLLSAGVILLFSMGIGPNAGPDTRPQTDRSPAEGKSVTMQVDAGRSWQDTGVEIQAKIPVKIKAGGQWKAGPNAPACSADGDANQAKDRNSYNGADAMCLLARIGDERIPLAVGKEKLFYPETSGRLFLQANDLDLGDNSGSLTVTIEGGSKKSAPAADPGLTWIEAAEIARQQPSPLDGLDPVKIPAAVQESWRVSGFSPPKEVVAVLGEQRGRHVAPVFCVAFDPTGKLVASGGEDGAIGLWDAQTLMLRKTIKTTGMVFALQFSRNGKSLLSGSSDKTVRLWDVETGAELRCFEGHTEAVESVAIAPNGLRVLSGGRDKTMRLWDLDSGRELRRFEGSGNWVRSVAFTPDGRTALASGGDDGTARLWNLETGAEIRRLEGHAGWVQAVAIAPDGRQALTAAGGILRLWDLEAGKELRRLESHPGVDCVAFSPDGRWAVSGAWDERTVRLWDVETGREIRRLIGHTIHMHLNSVCFSPDGRYVLSGSLDHTIRLWDLRPEKGPLSLEGKWHLIGPFDNTKGNGFGTVYPPEKEIDLAKTYPGKGDVTASWKEFPDFRVAQINDLARFDANDSACVYVYHEINVKQPAELLVSLGSKDTLTVWLNGECLVAKNVARQAAPDQDFATLKLKSGKNQLLVKVCNGTGAGSFYIRPIPFLVHSYAGHQSRVSTLAFSPDGRILATAGMDWTVKLWDTATGRELRTLKGHQREVRAVAFSPDGALLVSAGDDVRVWEVATGKELYAVSEHGGDVTTVAFSPDGKLLATGSYDLTVKVWAITKTSANELFTLHGHESYLWSVAFSPDGKTLASGSHDQGGVKLWDLSTGRQRATFQGPIDHVVCVKYDPEGRLLALASYHGAVRCWDARTGEERIVFESHKPNGIPRLALSPNGRILASACREGRVILSDAVSGTKLQEWQFPWPVTSVAFAPDGRHLALGHGNGTVYFCRVQAGR